jgi:hypothetical protein
MMLRMIAVYSRQPLQKPARCLYRSAFQAAVLSGIYGARPAYLTIMPSTNEMDSPSRLAGH